MKVYRVQASDGRGPFRPGLTKHWADADHDRPMPIQHAFDSQWLAKARRKVQQGWMYGCGCESLNDLGKWFSMSERAVLVGLGYWPVIIEADEIIRRREGEQVIFGCKKKFNEVAERIPWAWVTTTEYLDRMAREAR